MLSIIIMIVGGLIAAMNLIAILVPKTKVAFDKMIPYQGIFGFFLIVWSVITIIQLLSSGLFSVLAIVVIIIQLLTGFLLSFSLLSKYIFRTVENKSKGESIKTKLEKFQIPMGVFLVIYGFWSLFQFVF